MKLHFTKNEMDAVPLDGHSSAERAQFVCLMVIALVELLFFLLEDRNNGITWYLLERYAVVPAMIFLGTALSRNLSREAKHMLALSAAMLVWFFFIQVVRRLQGFEKQELGIFFCTYGMLLPFAAVTGDENRQRGLKLFGALFLAVGVLLVGYAALLIGGRVPGYLQDHVFWDGTRFYAMGHPNRCAAILLISTAFSMGFFFRVRNRWAKTLLVVWSGVQFAAISITNGRTTIIFVCMLLGGIAFCALRRPGWKRVLAALLVAIMVMCALFVAYQAIADMNKSHLKQMLASEQKTNTQSVAAQGSGENDASTDVNNSHLKQTEAPEQKINMLSVSGQGSWENDMRSLNGRTKIWAAALEGLENNPQIKFVGTDYVALIVSQYGPAVPHTHNSWLEVLYQRGIPGLALALVITVIAVWNAAVVLWRNTDLWKSCIALLVLCLLGCSMLEPYLFTSVVGYHYFDMLFMLCVGYLYLWGKQKS